MNFDKDLEKRFSLVTSSVTPDWVARMHEHYYRTGSYRAEDVRRISGDASRRIEIGGITDVTAAFKSS